MSQWEIEEKKKYEGFNENLGEGNRENDKLIFYNM